MNEIGEPAARQATHANENIIQDNIINMQYTLNTHNIRHLLSKHNTVTTPHSHMCNLISYVNSPARLRCAGGEINRIHSSVHSQFIGNRNSNSSAVSSHAKRLFGCHLAYGVHWKSPY